MPATVQARTQQRSITFHGSIDKTTPASTFVVAVGDGGNLAEDQIPVLPSFRPPVLNLPGTQIVKVGQSVSFRASAEDPSGLSTKISADKLPPGATWEEDSDRVEWSPAPNQLGEHALVFTAANSIGATSQGQGSNLQSTQASPRWPRSLPPCAAPVPLPR